MNRITNALAGAVLTLCAAALPGTSSADIHVALQLTSPPVQPDSTFEVDFVVTQAGTTFNAYDASIAWDPAVLTFKPTVPVSLQEGEYMKNACGNTFLQFQSYPSSVSISHSLLCNGISLTGPGRLFKLHFVAPHTPRITTLYFMPGLQFYDAGMYTGPVVADSLVVNIGGVTGVGAGRPGAPAPRVTASPTPFRGSTTFRVEGAAGAPALTVYDTAGHAVRHLALAGTGGSARATWDGRTDRGTPAPAGAYYARLRGAARETQAKVTLVR